MDGILFDNPIRTGKVRKNVNWCQYPRGLVTVGRHRFYGYSITESIKIWRRNNPIKK